MRTSTLLRSVHLFLIICILSSKFAMSQVTVPVNTPGGGAEFVGWNNGGATKDLDIKNEIINQNITIQNGGFPASLRMFFDPYGNVGIGDNIYPLTLFHLHQILANTPTVMHFSNSGVGVAYVTGFDFQQEPTGEMLFIQQENKTIRFDAKSNTSAGIQHRLDINSEAFTPSSASWDRTRVWISQQNTSSGHAVSMLQIGDLAARNNAGNREWMDYGTYIAGGDDNCYFGLKNEDADIGFLLDHNDAVINWGDNEFVPDNLNDLRFIFTGSFGSGGLKGQMNGLEMGRISYEGNFGIGNFYNHPGVGAVLRPARRLEILGDGGSSPDPQLRVTFAQRTGSQVGRYTDIFSTTTGDLAILPISESTAGIPTPRFVGINTIIPLRTLETFFNGGVAQFRITQNNAVGANSRYTDFETTATGDLIIRPRANTTLQKVGINTLGNPVNTLEIYNATSGESGLTFSNLNSGYTPTFTPTGKVLTVDGTGKVVLTDDLGNINSCSTSGNMDHIMKYNNATGTQACQAFMQENSNGFVGIGTVPVANQGLSIVNSTTSAASVGLSIESASTNNLSYCIKLSPKAFDNWQYGTFLSTNVAGRTPSSAYAWGHWTEMSGNNISNSGYYAGITGGSESRRNTGFFADVTGAQGSHSFNYGAHLNAYGDDVTANYGAWAHAQYGASAYGVYGYGQDAILTYGVYGDGNGITGSTNYGVYGRATYRDAKENTGVYGMAVDGDIAYGVRGVAKQGVTMNVGVWGEASAGANATYGVYR